MADDKTPVTDDQELAQVLASMNQQANAGQGETAAAPAVITPSADFSSPAPASDNVAPIPATLPSAPAAPEAPAPYPAATPSASTPASTGPLDDIKRQALEELRPIVSQLDLPAEEKFDALLLVIRSSDDQSLISVAYEAAEGITDQARKAQALLDIVKEIEYFSQGR